MRPHFLCDLKLATALLWAALETQELGPIVPAGPVTVGDRSAFPSGSLLSATLQRVNLCVCSAARAELEKCPAGLKSPTFDLRPVT